MTQLLPAFVSIGGSGAPGAAQSLTIRLDPAGLGQVEVRIERPADGPARVALTVERAETLLTLQRDREHLDRALDLAGVPSGGRVVQFSLAPADSMAAVHGAPLPGLATGGLQPGVQGGLGSGAQGAGGGGGGQGFGSSNAQTGGGPPDGGFGQGGREPGGRRGASPGAWLRAGIDITA